MSMRARFTHRRLVLPALALGAGCTGCSLVRDAGTADIPQAPACAPFDYIVAPRAAGSLCVSLPCSLLTAPPFSLQADGDTIYYSDRTQILTFDVKGQPQPLGAPPMVTLTASDGTTQTWQPEMRSSGSNPDASSSSPTATSTRWLGTARA
jgi:hypothetical protein